jgi:hypothetical protein
VCSIAVINNYHRLFFTSKILLSNSGINNWAADVSSRLIETLGEFFV